MAKKRAWNGVNRRNKPKKFNPEGEPKPALRPGAVPDSKRAKYFKGYGPFKAASRHFVDTNGILNFSWAGKPMRVRLRKSDRGKELELREYNNGIVVVDAQGNFVHFIPREILPKPEL